MRGPKQDAVFEVLPHNGEAGFTSTSLLAVLLLTQPCTHQPSPSQGNAAVADSCRVCFPPTYPVPGAALVFVCGEFQKVHVMLGHSGRNEE